MRAVLRGEALRRFEVSPREVRHRQQRHLRDGFGDTENLPCLALKEQVIGCLTRTNAACTQREHE